MKNRKGLVFSILAVIVLTPVVVYSMFQYDDFQKLQVQAEAGRVYKIMSIQERLIAREKKKEIEAQIPSWPKIEKDKWYCVKEGQFDDASNEKSDELVSSFAYLNATNIGSPSFFCKGTVIEKWGVRLYTEGRNENPPSPATAICFIYISGPFDSEPKSGNQN